MPKAHCVLVRLWIICRYLHMHPLCGFKEKDGEGERKGGRDRFPGAIQILQPSSPEPPRCSVKVSPLPPSRIMLPPFSRTYD
jgi:hypothetical protein